MLASIKNTLKWGSLKNLESKKNKRSSLLLEALLCSLEDILFWNKTWLSLSFILFLNTFFFICIHWEINNLELFFCVFATILSVDAFETWLKFKHRTACLKRLSSNRGTQFDTMVTDAKNWIRRRWIEYVHIRENNHTKAFLLGNIVYFIIFVIGKYMSGYFLLYLLCMTLTLSHKIAPPILRFAKKIQQHAESDNELEGLIPEVSETDIKLLSIDPEPAVIDERQSLDYWKPDDLPLGEASDSSDNSSSLVTNLSIEKMRSLDKEVESSESSEDEYIPLDQKEQLQSTLEVVQPTNTWSSSAYNALFNITGAVANMVYAPQEQTKRKRVSSMDSSDGFEMIDTKDLN